MRYYTLGAIIGFITLAVTSAFAQVTVYSNDFNSGSTAGFSSSNLTLGTRTDGAQTYLATPNTGSNTYGFGAGTTALTLNNPNLVGQVNIKFDLYMIGSPDGNGPAGNGPDPWQLTENGNNLLLTNFANVIGDTQAYPSQTAPFGPGASNPPHTGSDAALAGQLGFGTGDFGDSTYHLSFTFPNASSNLMFIFGSGENEPATNEGWGLDNVVVTSVPPVTATPEPGAFALAAAFGLAGVGFLRRRKHSN